ncbi:hypothetical protein EIP91_001741 [Steccherinum ochraceum]|uniref:MYND-type domain-containing protein n=1 Tax=Steccherinum ochraceum TaxID=92696 RepID=A0A4R0RFT8_9APHY|nr:hypothetical protein EIP91_001741 [Steccherinum ochraceum]
MAKDSAAKAPPHQSSQDSDLFKPPSLEDDILHYPNSWYLVLAQKPEYLVQWLNVLWKRDDPMLGTLMKTLKVNMDFGLTTPGQWDAFSATRLPCLLMEMMTDSGLVGHNLGDGSHSKPVHYASSLMTALRTCVYSLLEGVQAENPRDIECAREVLKNLKKLCRALWAQRHLLKPKRQESSGGFTDHLPSSTENDHHSATGSDNGVVEDDGSLSWTTVDSDTDGEDVSEESSVGEGNCATKHSDGDAELPETCATCIELLVRVYVMVHGQVPPHTSYAPHLLLFYWTYCPDEQSANLALSITEKMYQGWPQQVDIFLEQVILCGPEYPLHYLAKLSRQLRDQTITEESAIRLALLCSMSMRNVDQLLTVQLPEGQGLVRSLIIACQRQMCSSSDWVAEMFIAKTVQVIGFLLGRPTTRDFTMDQLDKYTKDLNFIVILSRAFINHVKESDSEGLKIAIHTLGFLYRIAIKIHETPSRPVLQSDLYITAARTWHDTMKALSHIRPKDVAQTALKNDALKHWRLYGKAFYFKENDVKFVTLKRASPLSTEEAYWRIPRECFWLECACAGHDAHHSVRVCKGCWRAVYCGKFCQEQDWKAGHRDLCRAQRVGDL